jgi:hypothetical protein
MKGLIISFLTYLLLTGCVHFGMTPEQLAFHAEWCKRYQGTNLDCLLPNPQDQIWVTFPDGGDTFIDRGRIFVK